MADRTLISFAKDAEDIAAGLHTLRGHLPRSATRITAVISELFSISSTFREIDNAEADTRFSSSFYRIEDDLVLAFASLQRTNNAVFEMFARSRDSSYQIAWDDLAYLMERQESIGLLERLEWYHEFLSGLFDIVTGYWRSDLSRLRQRLEALLDTQELSDLRRQRQYAPPPSHDHIRPQHDRDAFRNADISNLDQAGRATSVPRSYSERYGDETRTSFQRELSVSGQNRQPLYPSRSATFNNIDPNDPMSRYRAPFYSPASQQTKLEERIPPQSQASYAGRTGLVATSAGRMYNRLGMHMSGSAYSASTEASSEHEDLEFRDAFLFFDTSSTPVNRVDHEKLEQKTQLQPHVPLGSIEKLEVLSSRWFRTKFERNEIKAELDVVRAPPQISGSSVVPQIQWYHLERSSMNFDEFISAAHGIAGVEESKKGRILGLLREVQRSHEKRRPNGRQMTPNFITDVFRTETGLQAEGAPVFSISFLSLQYFALEPYDSRQVENLGPDSPIHPLRSLLQCHFHSVSKKRELAQAVSTLPQTPKGHCLHASEIWTLIISDQVMLTCSRLSLDDLYKDSIRITSVPPIETNLVEIRAAAGRTWQAPIETTSSPPVLFSLFGDRITDLGGLNPIAEIKVGSRRLDHRTLPNKAPALQSTNAFFSLHPASLKIQEIDISLVSSSENKSPAESDSGDDASEFKSSDETEDDRSSEPSTSGESKRPSLVRRPTEEIRHAQHLAHRSLKIFFRQHAESPGIDMHETADKLHASLLSYHRKHEKSLYSKCTSGEPSEVDEWLAAFDVELNTKRLGHDLSMDHYKKGITLLAKYIFGLFWPMDFKHQMTDKFWSALHSFLCRQNFYLDDEDPEKDRRLTYEVYQTLQDELAFTAFSLTKSCWTPEQNLPFPPEFSRAWLHFLLSFILLGGSSLSKPLEFRGSLAYKHLSAAARMLNQGEVSLTAEIRPAEIQNFEFCSLSSIAAICLDKLLRDITHSYPDVYTTYHDALQSLEFAVTQDPLPRSHQERIRFFVQEIDAILAVLESQYTVLEDFYEAIRLSDMKGPPIELLLPRLGESRRDQILADCKSRLATKIELFRALRPRTEELGDWHRSQIESNKDRQESAIITFTIVTIIFLPLTFVSGIFGMNTNDVRNLSLNQWIYWITAIPLTVMVVLGAVWSAGEWEALGIWFRKGVSSSKKLPGPYQSRNQDTRLSLLRLPNATASHAQLVSNVQQDPFAPPRRRNTYPAKPETGSLPAPSRRSTGRSFMS